MLYPCICNYMKKSRVLILFGLIVLASYCVTADECPPNEVKSSCEPCIKTCDQNWNPPICDRNCKQALECHCNTEQDLLRDRDGQCVNKNQCSLTVPKD